MRVALTYLIYSLTLSSPTTSHSPTSFHHINISLINLIALNIGERMYTTDSCRFSVSQVLWYRTKAAFRRQLKLTHMASISYDKEFFSAAQGTGIYTCSKIT